MKNHYRLFIIFLGFLQIVAVNGANAGSDFYYSIHGASYRDQEQAKAHVVSIENIGYPAFLDKVNIQGKGLWYRVYIGKYGNREAAKKTANILQKKNVIDNVRINRFMGSDALARTSVKKKEKKEAKPALKLREPMPTFPNEDRKEVAFSLGNKEKREEKIVPKLQEHQPTIHEGDGKSGESEPVASPLDNAISAIKSERYGQAIELIKVLLNKGNPDKATLEKCLRLMADCYYSLGTKGNRQLLLTAVDQYKEILRRYPDPAGDNDRLYFNLAMSYEKLNFFYEASGTLEKLIFVYPDSPFLAEAMFKVGDVLRYTGKYGRTADKLMAYLKKYPEGKFAKAAYFTLGDCYYKMQKNDLASRWFDEARKKWFDLQDIPQMVLLNMGNNYYESGRFDDAFQVYSFCASLYSGSDFGKNTLFKTARAADEAGHASLAIKLYSSFMAKHPGDELVDECSLFLANLGVVKPGMRVSINVANMDDYREPLQTYKRLLSKNAAGGNQTERVMLFKGRTLEKNGTTKDAFTNYLSMLSMFPRGKYRDETLSRFKNQVLLLCNTYYAKGDHLAVSDLYFQVKEKITLVDDFDTSFKIGHSLQTLGLYDEAGGLYTALKEINKSNRERISILTLALVEMDVLGGKYSQAAEKIRLLLIDREEKSRGKNGPIKQTLADIYFKEGSFEKAAAFYADVLGNETSERQSTAYINYARSLQNRQMQQDAQKNYLKAYKDYQKNPEKYDKPLIVELFIGLADGYCSEKKFKEGIIMYRQALLYVSDIDSKRWLLFKIGQGYTYLNDYDEAEKSFAQIKEGTEGEYWMKIADLYIAESRRMEKNEVRR